MVNAQKVKVGDLVRYRKTDGRWTAAKVTAVTSQTAVKLAIVNPNGTRTALNAGADVARAPINVYQLGTTNVWKVY